MPDKEESSTFEDYLGPNYPYHGVISSPADMGMSPDGDIDQIITNAVGLVNYGKLLMDGAGNANKKMKFERSNLGADAINSSGAPGDRIFIKTKGSCTPVKYFPNKEYSRDVSSVYINGTTDYETEIEEPMVAERWAFVNHIPTGAIPGLGDNSTSLKGFIPGIIENVFELNPLKIVSAVMLPPNPDCVFLEMETMKYNHKASDSDRHTVEAEGQWVTIDDIQSLNTCVLRKLSDDSYPKINGVTISHPGGDTYKNPFKSTESTCYDMIDSDGFRNLFSLKNNEYRKPLINLKDKPIAKLFNLSFGVLMVYLLYKVLEKE